MNVLEFPLVIRVSEGKIVALISAVVAILSEMIRKRVNDSGPWLMTLFSFYFMCSGLKNQVQLFFVVLFASVLFCDDNHKNKKEKEKEKKDIQKKRETETVCVCVRARNKHSSGSSKDDDDNSYNNVTTQTVKERKESIMVSSPAKKEKQQRRNLLKKNY